MRSAFDTPWKITNRFFSLLIHPYVHLLFKFYGIPWGQDWHFFGVPIIQKHRNSSMIFDTGLQLRSSIRSNPLGPNRPVILSTWKEGAILEVGKNFSMSGGTICAFKQIVIGNNVSVGCNTTIVDTDFHPLDPEFRHQHPQDANSAPVIIEDDVFIGMNCLILKGITIGFGSVIGAGSVVTHNVSPRVVVAGNPARVLREL